MIDETKNDDCGKQAARAGRGERVQRRGAGGSPSPCCGPPPGRTEEAPCCGREPAAECTLPTRDNAPWMEGSISTAAGEVPRTSTVLGFGDKLGAWKARWGIGRMHYTVSPGLYAVGEPTGKSPVFVTANYKMSFDRLRSHLGGRYGWIMVLDTKGINVWCAAGKGTFGTDEVVRRAEAVQLGEIVSHRRLILPQLGAPGVSAHEVGRRTGFSVVYGPVRAEDLPSFLDAGMRATPAMRHVRFTFSDRVPLIPMELVMSARFALPVAAGFFFLAGIGRGGYSLARAAESGPRCALLFIGAYLAGAALTPALLPWLPGRSFSAKGAWAGLAFAAIAGAGAVARPAFFENGLSAAAWLLIISAVASFLGMNFTGASTYTSLSGVKREMRVAVPIQMACATAGLGLWVVSRFI